MKKAKRRTRELLSGTVAVRSCKPSINLNSGMPYAREKFSSFSLLEVRGVLDAPIQGETSALVILGLTDEQHRATREPLRVGDLTVEQDEVRLWVPLIPSEFERVWVMALTGALARIGFTSTELEHRHEARLLDVSFRSTRLADEDGERSGGNGDAA